MVIQLVKIVPTLLVFLEETFTQLYPLPDKSTPHTPTLNSLTPILKLFFNLYLGLSIGFLPSGFPTQL